MNVSKTKLKSQPCQNGSTNAENNACNLYPNLETKIL